MMSVSKYVHVIVIIAIFQNTSCYNTTRITVPAEFIADLYFNWPLTNVAVLYGSLFEEDLVVEKNMVSLMNSLLNSGLMSSFEYYQSAEKHIEIEMFRNYIVLCDTLDMNFFINKTSFRSKWKSWFLITSLTNDELRAHMSFLDLSYDSLLYSAHINQQHKILVYKWHKAYKQSVMNETQIAAWNEQGSHDFLRHKFTSETNNNLQGIEITVGIYHDPPLLYINRHSEQGINVSGYLPEIWETLGMTLNFRTKYYEIDERREGTETNNMWSGLLGELQKGRIDVGLQALIISHKMHDVIEPSLPVIQLSLHLYMRRPDLDKHWLAYVQPFTWQTWCCIGATLFILSSAKFIVFWTKQHLGAAEENNEMIKAEDTFLITIGALLQQSCDRSPNSIAARQIFWFCFTLSMVLYTAYSAALISNLTVPKLMLPVNCIDQLLQSQYKVLVMSESGVHNLLKSSLHGKFADLYENLFANGDLISALEDGLQLVSERGDILLAISQRVAARIGKLKCIILNTKNPIRKLPGSFAFRKGFPFSIPINRLLLKMATSGQLDRMQKVWWDIPGHYCSTSAFVSMGFENVYFIIFGWLIGLLIALIIFVIEVLYFWLSSSKLKK